MDITSDMLNTHLCRPNIITQKSVISGEFKGNQVYNFY